MRSTFYILIVAGCCLLNLPLPAHALPISSIYVFVKPDLGKWAKVVRDSGAKVD